MTIHSRTIPLLASTLGLLSCAPEGGFARAFQMASLSEGIGGPKAIARPGDFVLENDKVRVAILGPRNSLGPHTSGASLIDADLQRPDPRYSQGRGLDQLAEVFPTVNLNVAQADETVGAVEIIADGSGGGAAIICTEGPEKSFITLLDSLWAVQWPGARPYFRIRTDYILEPGASAVLIRTYAVFADEAGCQEDIDAESAAYSTDGLPLLDRALSKTEGGLVFGDFYLQGGSTDVFTPGVGFDETTFVNDLLETGVNTFTDPIQVPFLAGTADRVSYGLMPAGGDIFVPMFTSSQTVAVGAEVKGDGTSTRFPAGAAYSYDRYLAIGRGDVGSVVDALMEVRGDPVGQVFGHVAESSTGSALSGVRVFAFAVDPDSGDANPAPYLEWTTDVGDDTQIDGSFGGSLPPGTWDLKVHALGRPDSQPVRVTVQEGKRIDLVLEAPRPGEVRFEVRDGEGTRVPAKVTLFATGDSPRDPVLGDGFIADSPAHVTFALHGTGSVVVPPGNYYAEASRGLEYDLGRSPEFHVGANQAVDLDLQVVRSVDSTGWISADFHVHGFRSHDSGVGLEARVGTMASEGVEFMASTDHDSITDYKPAIMGLGVEEWISSTVGLEVTTIEVGHFLGFPLVMDQLGDGGGAIDWTGLTPDEMIEGIRNLGQPGDERDPVVFVGHPRDGILGYFDQFGMDPYRLNSGGDLFVEQSLLALNNDLLKIGNFSTDFDAIEVLNGKRQEMIRTPTWDEMSDLAASGGDLPVYDLMARTMDEQDALIAHADWLTCLETTRRPRFACPEPDVHMSLGPDWEGVLDDWFHTLNLGYRFTALGNSDTHGKTSTESGCPRNYVQAETDDPGFLDEHSVAQAVKEGRVVASTGPFIRFSANAPENGPGSELSTDQPVLFNVEVQTPGWFDVNRVELYENGTLIHEWSGDEVLDDATYNLTAELEVTPTIDAWYVVVALGDDDLAPVFTPVEIAPIQLEDVVSGALSGLGAPFDSLLAEGVPVPRTFPVHPYAVTNPIWIDADADGEWMPPGPPAWWRAPDPLDDGE